MEISVSINISYTEQATKTIGTVESVNLNYAAGIPLPEKDDYVETKTDSGSHALKVIERAFSFGPNSVTIDLLLDLP